jgi:hypothetical protein
MNLQKFLYRRSQAPYEILKPEEARYQWLEKELLNTVKTEIQQKMKKQSNKVKIFLFLICTINEDM